MGQLQVLEFPFVCPAGFLLGAGKEGNKPPGLSSSAGSYLGECMREKLTHNSPCPGCGPTAHSFPSGHHPLSSTHQCSTLMGYLGVQLAQGLIQKSQG